MKVTYFLGVLAIVTSSCEAANWGGLYPRESASREVRSLDGIWDFRVAPRLEPDKGFNESWFSQPLKMTGSVIRMPVPSSYNDVTEDKSLRDHIGWAWYDRTFFVPKRWIDDKQRVVLRIGSAHYNSIVYVNGMEVATHSGGHLPIMAEITSLVKYGEENLVTICMNNTLTPYTIPQGSIVHQNDEARYPPGYFVQNLDFDFFNYAGLHRPVYVYTTPQTYIEDVAINTEIDTDGTTGYIFYNVTVSSTGSSEKISSCSLKLYDQMGNYMKSAIGCMGRIDIDNANFWWPYLMDSNPGYMYTLQIAASDISGVMDIYPQKVGIRVMGWNSTTVTINGKPLYLFGVGKHEDSSIRGKGVDNALIVKDFNLLKWLGANSFRTSHYPYAEEIMDMADSEGIMVIDESPAVGLHGFGDVLLNTHMEVMHEYFRRDKNRPSVIMWSVGNEPKSAEVAAGNYFKEITDFTRSLDSSRPVTCVINVNYNQDLAVVGLVKALDSTRPVTCVLSVGALQDQAAASLDVILVNRYFSWYGDTGHLEVIQRQTLTEFRQWHLLYSKPVMISEYGAGSLAGTHIEPSFTWSEEYQVDLLLENFKAFDVLRAEGFFFGEHIWNFADFATEQGTTRPPGNRKGIFTRTRQPKMAAHFMRYRYHALQGNQTLEKVTRKLFDKFLSKY